MDIFACMYVCTICTVGASVSEPLEMVLQIVSHHSGVGNQTQVLFKSSKCSQWLSLPSGRGRYSTEYLVRTPKAREVVTQGNVVC